MKTWISIVVVAAQAAVLAWMAAEREWVIHTGVPVVLRTAPVDPRDPMRGDYVRLSYDMSRVPERLCRDGLLPWFSKTPPRESPRDKRVYAVLQVNSSGVAELVSLTDVPPTGGLFIRGRVGSIYAGHADVRYGLEALFTQQGVARDIERTRTEAMEGVPLDAEVAVRGDGLAVLTGHRWEPLGLRVTVERRLNPGETVEQARARGAGLIAVEVELKNHGDQPLAVVERAGGRSFRLVEATGWDGRVFHWVGESRPVPAPASSEVVVLQPGDVLTRRIDLTAPEWFVIDTPLDPAQPPMPVAMETLVGDWRARFRIEYVAPTDGQCATLPHAEIIRRMHVASPVFGAPGFLD